MAKSGHCPLLVLFVEAIFALLTKTQTNASRQLFAVTRCTASSVFAAVRWAVPASIGMRCKRSVHLSALCIPTVPRGLWLIF
eukprot:COSAG02_NODE_327_length_24561_cov_92.867754_4_plen_82_part_00